MANATEYAVIEPASPIRAAWLNICVVYALTNKPQLQPLSLFMES